MSRYAPLRSCPASRWWRDCSWLTAPFRARHAKPLPVSSTAPRARVIRRPEPRGFTCSAGSCVPSPRPHACTFNLPSPCHLIQIPCAQDLPWRLSSCTTHIELSCTPTVANFEFLTAEQLAAGNRARLGVSRYAPVALRVVVSLAHLNLLVLLLALDSSEAQPETWRRGHVRPERRRSDCSHVVGPSRPSLAPTGFAASTAVSPRCFLATAAPPLARRSAETVAPPCSSARHQR
jgi:hypothetical protein